MMLNCKLLAAGVVTLLLGFLTATPIQAATTALVVHSGLNCLPKPGDASKLAYNLAEGIRNTSTSATATVLCPADAIVAKQDTSFVGGPLAVRVRVFDRSSTANVSCALKAIVANNGFVSDKTFPVKSSSGSFNSPDTLEWTAADGITVVNHTYRVSCTLPRASGSGASGVQQIDVEVTTP